MGRLPSKCGHNRGGTGSGPAWGWLVAAAGGLLVGRARSRLGVAVGVGMTAWACWRSFDSGEREEVIEGGVASSAPCPAGAVVGTDHRMVRHDGEEVLVGSNAWILNLEPMPSVVGEGGEVVPPADMGLGLEWLGHGPLLTSEELDESPSLLPQSEEAWLNGGAEIPDSVELPEVDGGLA
jgi:hypothetical protein